MFPPRRRIVALLIALVADSVTSAGEVDIHLNIPYREGCKACLLDLALPKAHANQLRPAIVVIHGGGWIEGDKSSFASSKHGVPGNIEEFAQLGLVAAGINYRLAGEAPYPAALDDCRCAIRWLRAHADEYHIDRDRIGAYGNSAGGHLALLLAMTDGSANLDPAEPYANRSSRLQAAASDSGPLDLVYQHEHQQLVVAVEKFMGGPPSADRIAQYRLASPSSHVASATPPVLLIYGGADEQVDVRSADRFVAALGQAGNSDVTYIRLATVGHCPHSMVRIRFLKQVVNEFFVRTLQETKEP